jgi:hypothetical protein
MGQNAADAAAKKQQLFISVKFKQMFYSMYIHLLLGRDCIFHCCWLLI